MTSVASFGRLEKMVPLLISIDPRACGRGVSLSRPCRRREELEPVLAVG